MRVTNCYLITRISVTTVTEQINFFDTMVYKGLRFNDAGSLNIKTHVKRRISFQCRVMKVSFVVSAIDIRVESTLISMFRLRRVCIHMHIRDG